MNLRSKYTERELIIIGLFSLKVHVSVPEMIEAISRVAKRPTRQNIISQLRSMANKLASDGYVIRRTSRLGRGAFGVYVMAKIGGKSQ